MPDGIWEVGGRPAPGRAVAPDRGGFGQRFPGEFTQQLHGASGPPRPGRAESGPRPTGTTRGRLTPLRLRAEQVVVVDPARVDRRRELPGRHPAQRRVAVPELVTRLRVDERPRARGLERAGVERPPPLD